MRFFIHKVKNNRQTENDFTFQIQFFQSCTSERTCRISWHPDEEDSPDGIGHPGSQTGGRIRLLRQAGKF